MSEERILTLHPQGKNGVNIPLKKYNQVKDAIFDTVEVGDEISLKNLEIEVSRRLKDTFDGSIIWHLISVKHDLEAKKILEVVPKVKPQHLRRLN